MNEMSESINIINQCILKFFLKIQKQTVEVKEKMMKNIDHIIDNLEKKSQ